VSGMMNGKPLALRSSGGGIDSIGERYFARCIHAIPKVAPETIRKFCTFPKPEQARAIKDRIEKPSFRPVKGTRSYRHITEADAAKICAMWEAGHHTPAISAAVKREPKTVRYILRKRLGLKTLLRERPKHERIEALIAGGASFEEAAQRTDSTVGYVKRLMREKQRNSPK
jgi:hypothetical protein